MSERRGRRFTDKIVLVTGGNAGIGLAAARAFALEGARVMIAARRREQGEAAVASIRATGGEARFVATDVTQGESVRAMVAACVAAYGGLDIAFNNAGVTGDTATPIAAADEALFDQVMAINAKGVWLCMKYEWPELLKRGGGSIINCSSLAGIRGGAGRAGAYYASKHAVLGLTKQGAVEGAAQGIRVNAVLPGLVATDMVASGFAEDPAKLQFFKTRIPMQRVGEPDEVAGVVLWLASPESSYVTGEAIRIDGGMGI